MRVYSTIRLALRCVIGAAMNFIQRAWESLRKRNATRQADSSANAQIQLPPFKYSEPQVSLSMPNLEQTLEDGMTFPTNGMNKEPLYFYFPSRCEYDGCSCEVVYRQRIGSVIQWVCVYHVANEADSTLRIPREMLGEQTQYIP